jgi:drug/metabolite transporter (DMT)-like permease
MITRKPPSGLEGAPYLVERDISLKDLKAPVKIFNGSARDGARGFPANVNVAAALSLAMAMGTTVDHTGALYAVVSGAITSGLGYVLWYAVLPSLTAASAAVIQLSVPAIAALGGVVLLAEPLSSRLVIASATILGGIALTILRPRT